MPHRTPVEPPRRSVTAIVGSALALALAAVLSGGPAVAASTAPPFDPGDEPAGLTTVIRPGPVTTTTLDDVELADIDRTFSSYSVVNLTRHENVVQNEIAAKCLARTAGGTCAITSGVSVSATIETALGATAQMVTVALREAGTRSVLLNVGCTSPALSAGQVFAAHAVGTTYTYQIRSTSLFGDELSPQLTAFLPDPNAIACGVTP